MKHLYLLLICAMFAGCASLENAGHSSLEVKANSQGSYDLSVRDGKEYAGGRSIMFNADTGVLVYSESGSKAFKGQAISAKAATILPLSDLVDILGK